MRLFEDKQCAFTNGQPRVRCICYMVAFNSFSSGSRMFLFGVSWIIDCLVLFLIL